VAFTLLFFIHSQQQQRSSSNAAAAAVTKQAVYKTWSSSFSSSQFLMSSATLPYICICSNFVNPTQRGIVLRMQLSARRPMALGSGSDTAGSIALFNCKLAQQNPQPSITASRVVQKSTQLIVLVYVQLFVVSIVRFFVFVLEL
jgi:hypothetical protein